MEPEIFTSPHKPAKKATSVRLFLMQIFAKKKVFFNNK